MQASGKCTTLRSEFRFGFWEFLAGVVHDRSLRFPLFTNPKRILNSAQSCDPGAARENKAGYETGRPPSGFTQRYTETDKIFDVHTTDPGPRLSCSNLCLSSLKATTWEVGKFSFA